MAVNLGINIQRSPNRINQQLREAGVIGKFPKLLLDFADNYYLANGGSKTLANAVTHARAGNATMTDGYGPELVTNGGFTGNADNWTLVDSTYRDNAVDVATTSAVFPLTQTSTTAEAGKSYVVTFQARNKTGPGAIKPNFGGVDGTFRSTEGYHTEIITASTTGALIFKTGGSAFTGTIDNVSVREMPVIKWAPHNLVIGSEDPLGSAWSEVNATVDENATDRHGISNSAVTVTSGTGGGSSTSSYTRNSPFVFSSGDPHTVAVYLKADQSTAAAISITAYDVPVTCFFDLASGSVGYTNGNEDAVSITDVGSGWYLCKITRSSNGSDLSGQVRIGPAANDGSLPTDINVPQDGSASIIFDDLHIYRSDLGGMVDNPESGDSYVPTTSAAKYLPRIGHHVYNGSAWVNEGVLAESESRTNLIERSNTFDSVWSATGLSSRTANEVGPDGVDNSAYTLTASTAAGIHANGNTTLFTSGSAHTGSCYFKKGTQRYVKLRAGNTVTWPANVTFDLDNGTVDTETNGTGTIQEIGNGWYRCAVTATAASTANTNFNIYILNDSKAESFTGAGTETTIVWGAQLEVGATPSSFIPSDDGTSTVTRAAETFTIPSANLPWPTPQYIGSELVTNGTFDSDVSGWSAGPNDSSISWSSGQIDVTRLNSTTSGCFTGYQLVTGLTVGKTYWLQGDIITASHEASIVPSATLGSIGYDESYIRYSNNQVNNGFSSFPVTAKVAFEATATSMYIGLGARSNPAATATFDNISVREINPLSVSIGMEGRVTFADTDVGTEATFVRWFGGNQNLIINSLQTGGSRTGQIQFRQEANDVNDAANTSNTYFSPDILVPFNMASRHGSTFVNGAESGVALTANTTPVSLADLSSTDLELAYKYMGTISEFRVWDKDITDAGLVEATNPSLEPSLSLEFSGLGTNSFTVSDWSE